MLQLRRRIVALAMAALFVQPVAAGVREVRLGVKGAT